MPTKKVWKENPLVPFDSERVRNALGWRGLSNRGAAIELRSRGIDLTSQAMDKIIHGVQKRTRVKTLRAIATIVGPPVTSEYLCGSGGLSVPKKLRRYHDGLETRSLASSQSNRISSRTDLEAQRIYTLLFRRSGQLRNEAHQELFTEIAAALNLNHWRQVLGDLRPILPDEGERFAAALSKALEILIGSHDKFSLRVPPDHLEQFIRLMRLSRGPTEGLVKIGSATRKKAEKLDGRNSRAKR